MLKVRERQKDLYLQIEVELSQEEDKGVEALPGGGVALYGLVLVIKLLSTPWDPHIN